MPAHTNEELYYRIALSFAPGIGAKIGRALLERYGSASAIFKAKAKELITNDGVTDTRARALKDEDLLRRAEEEMNFVLKHNITVLSISDDYPAKLANCADAPPLLYYKGNANLNAKKTVAIVGTRKNTDYGHKLTEDLVEQLQNEEDILIVSGLALGIDAIAHKKCVQLGMPTVGVLGHGLDNIYPPNHKQLSEQMIEHGGILTEYPSGTKPDKGNFPMRNRIVAGLCDVTVVVESHAAGGALITASLASGYNREVAAFPGRVNDSRSAGCNNLIRSNTAALITSAADLLQLMGWDKQKKPRAVQPQLFLHLSPEEQKVVDVLQNRNNVHADEISYHAGIANSALAATLLQLEIQGVIRALPGKYYRIH
jgi:DNA processing protein